MKIFIALLFVTCLASPSAQSGEHILSKKALRTILGNFPEPGSEAEKQDDAILLDFQKKRTQKECDFAATQSKLHVENVFVLPSGPLTRAEMKHVKIELLKLQATVGINIVRAKRLYHRPRPYMRNHDIKPCIPLEKSSSYPSGHSTMGRAVSKYLSVIYPEKAKELLKVGNQIGTNRMLGGVHHPSDVEAGRKLGDAIADSFIHEDDEAEEN